MKKESKIPTGGTVKRGTNVLLLVVDIVVVVPDVVSVNGDVVVDVAVVHVVVVVVVDVVPVAVIVVAVVVVVVRLYIYIFLFLFGRYLPLDKKCAFFLQFLRYSEFRLDSFNLSVLVNHSCVPSLSQRRVQEGSNAIEQIHDCSVIFLGGKIGIFRTRSNEKSGI